MKHSENNIRLIFGLKLKQIRLDKNLSLSTLAKKASLSVSYLNEIENGKKYPKSNKIASLAEALDISYDKLVSLKLTKNLAPVSDLLESNILEQLPLDHYGIDVHKLLLQISQAPLQLSALVSTIIELAKSSEMEQNNFSRAAIRTYKELNDNYFQGLEDSVIKFCRKINFNNSPPVNYSALAKILIEEFHYSIDEEVIPDQAEFNTIRGINIKNGKYNKLLLNKKLTKSQKTFIVGKEIAYNYLDITDRSGIYSDLRLDSFDQLINNLKASYFSTALIIDKGIFNKDLEEFLSKDKFDSNLILSYLLKYNSSPEMLFQRITNLLSKYFNIDNFFFHRFNSEFNSEKFSLLKELRLNIPEELGSYQTTEHYCRRWVSINSIKRLEKLQNKSDKFYSAIADIQRSIFNDTNNEFISISLAKRSTLLENSNHSVTLGFLVNDEIKNKIKFLNDPAIKTRVVNDTCERCGIKDCLERVAPPLILENRIRLEKLSTSLQNIIDKEKY